MEMSHCAGLCGGEDGGGRRYQGCDRDAAGMADGGNPVPEPLGQAEVLRGTRAIRREPPRPVRWEGTEILPGEYAGRCERGNAVSVMSG